MMYLVYTSVATQPLSEEELADLLQQSKSNNQQSGITGLLLYREGLFMQLLEGPEDEVLNCYDRIRADPRHHDILKLVENLTRRRLFADWAMAFEHVSQAMEAEEGFSDFLKEPFSSDELGEELNDGLFLLLSFKKNTEHWSQYKDRL